MKDRKMVPIGCGPVDAISGETNPCSSVTNDAADTSTDDRSQVSPQTSPATVRWDVDMSSCENTMNLRFRPTSKWLERRSGNRTSTKQQKDSNYDESKTDGNIQKPWQCLLSIAVNTHPQMELYRLITTCVIGLMTELLIAKTAG